jgi:light-regulated signal transduction histidine kinase (bacteriophytochrome)
MQTKRFTGGLRIALVLACLSLAFASGYLAGIREAQMKASGPTLTRDLTIVLFGQTLHLRLSLSALGIAIIFVLTILLAAAVLFARVAQRRRRQVEVVNRKLISEISERKRAQDEVTQLNAELEQRVMARTRELQTANKELEAFCSSVSHDLRAPLRAIDGFSDALLKDYYDKLDEQGQRHLQRVRNAAQRMAELIDDLLSLSRVTRTEMRREEVNLTAVAREVVTELQQLDPGRNVEVIIAEGLVAHGDARLLRQVLENLLSNAWKYTSKQPAARIVMGTCEGGNGKPAFFVQDNGAGFDMAYVGKLFGVFQRLHSASDFPGTGVGLATVQRIIHRHGGEVWAEGSVGQGATFYFTVH